MMGRTAAASDSPASVLLVDDLRANLFALEAVLEPLGLRLVRAQSGAEALARAAEEDFALVLMDVQMPVLDGYETTRVLREKLTKNVPVIFVTAIHHDAEHIHRGYAAGGVDYLSKPIDPDVLKAKVRSFVELYRRDQIIRRQEARIREGEVATAAAEAANRAKDEFLRLISHELRTPLNTIVGWAETLDAGRLDEEQARAAVSAILRNARAQSAMIEDLVAFSEMMAGRLTVQSNAVDFAKIVAETVDVVRPSAQGKRIELRVRVEPAAAPMLGDALRLRHIVLKLVSNAVKFSDEGGAVDVELTRQGRMHRLVVRDFGAGIPVAYLPHVFDGFRQAVGGYARPHGGLGIGLALAKKLVDLHGGTIRAASDGAGRGTSFQVELPAVDAPAAPVPGDRVAARGPATASLDGVSLLVVDDEADTLDMTAEVLELEGAAVFRASSVAEALALLEKRRPDVILSDLSMPGEDGFALIAKVRALEAGTSAGVPVIAVSAHSDQDVRQKAQRAGFAAYVSKPFSPAELAGVIVGLHRARR